MNRLLRPILLFLLLLFPLGLAGHEPVQADPPKCTCREGNACYHFLNAPVAAPVDPCSCPLCRAAPGACPKKLPKGWDATCANNGRMECFLRRHAASWKLSCSERLSGTCECKSAHPEWCPMCGKNGHEWDDGGLAIVKKQMDIERNILGRRRKFILIKSPHFYLLTDIPSMKVATQTGAPRVMGMHEIAHLFIQRAEIAYQDFTRYFGAPTLTRPMAIYLMDKDSTMRDIQAAYFGSPRTNILYGGGTNRIAGGYPFNGFACCEQKSRDDDGLHLQVRHSIGHILLSCWVVVNGQEKYYPRWTYAGVGHWLSRMPERFKDSATFCADEGTAISNNGRNWHKNLLKIAGGGRSTPVQRVFDVNSMSALDLDMHIRAWSWFKIFLEEDRESFVKFIKGLRKGEEHRTALREAFGCSPEEFDRRWKQRILGKRQTVAPTAEELDEAKPDRPGARERASIRTETDLPTMAAKIRSLQAVNDPLTAATLVPILRINSELVRETIVLVLSKTKSPEVKGWLRTEGLSGHQGMSRAYVARIIGNIGDKDAGPELMKYTSDGFWLTRAHVARTLGLLQYDPAVPTLKEMAKDRAQKVRISAFDSVGRFGEKAASAWRPVSDQLGASAWQVRSAAAECLGELGQMQSVEPLISRMEIESGRIRQDIRQALKKITRDDLGNNPEHWRNWWEKEKERANGGLPPRGDKPKEPPKGEIRYGNEPTYYGLQVFSQGVGYVLDASSSMASTIKVDPNWIKKQRRDYPPAASKARLARNEIEASLRSLDPRVRFNLYFFRSAAYTWKNTMVPATRSNVDSAVNRLASEEPTSASGGGNAYQTNYVDVFRIVLDVKEGGDVSGNFGDTPDTIFFLTDGEPTAGDITDAEVLASWFRELNRFARVKVNVITFGNLGVDPEFLRRLAEENSGKFVQVPEVR
jgi:HEAT repeats/PBS lyase HEAT-like repeat